jgi:hypothetical protein
MTRRCFACLVVLTAAVACGSDDAAPSGSDPDTDDPRVGGQTGEETVGCFAVETRNLAWSEQSPLGFSADGLLNALGAEREARLQWANGSSTRLTLALERSDGAVAFEEREWVDAPSGAESGGAQSAVAEIAPVSCGNVVSVPVTLSLATNDGAFAEQLPLRLLAESTSRATAWISIDTADLTGSYSVTEVDPAAYDQVLAQFSLTFGGDAWTGSISGQAVDDGAGSADSASSARNFEIGAF